MLGVITLVDAYRMGVPRVKLSDIIECMERELLRPDIENMLKGELPERYTHALDVCDALSAVSGIAENAELKERLLAYIDALYPRLFDENGILSEKSVYYEGDRYTYSFRIGALMERRIEAAGGRAALLALLDSFFGFGGDSIKPLTYLGADDEINSKKYHRFEGFNNECDMESLYSYVYLDRQDRLSEINRECVLRSFGSSRSGLPGNNDSGGLSSHFVFSTLGIYPAAGSGEFLIGSPHINRGRISLATGNVLIINSHRDSPDAQCTYHATFNGEEIIGYRLHMEKLMQGGVLDIYMR